MAFTGRIRTIRIQCPGGPPAIYPHIRQQQVTFDTMVALFQVELLQKE
jgi:hypothetical protein